MREFHLKRQVYGTDISHCKGKPTHTKFTVLPKANTIYAEGKPYRSMAFRLALAFTASLAISLRGHGTSTTGLTSPGNRPRYGQSVFKGKRLRGHLLAAILVSSFRNKVVVNPKQQCRNVLGHTFCVPEKQCRWIRALIRPFFVSMCKVSQAAATSPLSSKRMCISQGSGSLAQNPSIRTSDLLQQRLCHQQIYQTVACPALLATPAHQ